MNIRTSIVFLVLLFSFAVPGVCQNDGGALGGLVQGIIRGRQLNSELQLNDALSQLLRAQTEATRLQNKGTKAHSANINQEFDRSLQAVRNRFPDFDFYAPESVRIMTQMNPDESVFSLEHYIEGMYLIAKYASFSAVSGQAISPLARLVREPVFYTIPMAARIRLVHVIEPQTTGIQDTEMETILTTVAQKLNIKDTQAQSPSLP